MICNLIGVGYWFNYDQPNFPDPGTLVKTDFDVNNINQIIYLLENAKTKSFSQMGFSWCRFRCGSENMGNKELTNGKYIWPEGLAHYVKEHKILLPFDFLESLSNDYYEISDEYTIDYNFWIDFCNKNKISKLETYKANYDIGHLYIELKTNHSENSIKIIDDFTKNERIGSKKLDVVNKLTSDRFVRFIGRFYGLKQFILNMEKNGVLVEFLPFTDDEYMKYKNGDIVLGEIGK